MNVVLLKRSYGLFAPYPPLEPSAIGIELSDQGSARVILVANNSSKNKY